MANVLTRAAAANGKRRASSPIPTRRSKRIREMRESKSTELEAAAEVSKSGKRSTSKISPEHGRKAARTDVTNGTNKKNSKSRPARTKPKKVNATRVLRAVEEIQRLRSEDEQSSREVLSTQSNPSEPLNNSGGQASDRSHEEQMVHETNAGSHLSSSPEAWMTDRNSIPGGPYAALLAARTTNPDSERLASRAGSRYDPQMLSETMREGLPNLPEAMMAGPDFIPGGRYALNFHQGTSGYQPSARSHEEQVNDETDVELRGSSLLAAGMTYPDSNVRNRYAPTTADRIADLHSARSRPDPRIFSEMTRAELPSPYGRYDETPLDERTKNPIPNSNRVLNDEFSQVLYNAVSTQRVLRHKRIQLQESQRRIQSALWMVHMYGKGTKMLNPTTDHDWQLNQAVREKISEWEDESTARQEGDSNIRSQIQFLEHRAEKMNRRLQACSPPSPGDLRLRYLSEDNDFWETYEKCQATAESLADIDLELKQFERDRDAIDDALDRKFEQSLEFDEGGRGSFSAPAWKSHEDEYVAEIPYLFRKLEQLQQRKQTAEVSNGEQWAQLVKLAEDALVKVEVLKALVYVEVEAEQENHRSASAVPEHPKTPVPNDVEEDTTAEGHVNAEGNMNAEDVLREELRVAKEACRKAREDFEGARDLTGAEIQQLPQPVTEDDLGVARFRKLCRLTQAFRESEDLYLEVRQRAQHAGITHPTEQLYDFDDRSDDGYAVSEVDRAADERREQVLRMHYWNGLDLESARSMSPEVGWTAGKELQALPDVRVGEDNFEGTVAVGRIRERIDVMAAITQSLRGQGDIPMPDRDEIIATPEEDDDEIL